MRVFKKDAMQSIPDDALTICQHTMSFPTHRLTITTIRQQNRLEGISLEQFPILAKKETLCLANHLRGHSCLKQITFSCSSFHSSSSH